MGSLTPRRGGERHKVVCLDAVLCPVPKFDFPHEYVEYQNTIGEDLIIERVRDATIIITSRAPVSSRTIAACLRLELVAFMTTGTDLADKKACRAWGIAVCNAPGANAESVAEHAFALYLAAKRKVVDLHRVTVEAEAWPREKNVFHMYPQLPRVLRHEVLGIVGYGAIGKCYTSGGRGESQV
jgi:glycerate dehydrogenase